MGVERICRNIRKRYFTTEEKEFRIQFFVTEDHTKLHKSEIQIILNEFADQKRHGGEICLGNTYERVKDSLENDDYTAVCIVSNGDDKAVGTLQYYDWCETGTPQLWVNDLCRITRNIKATSSPLKILMKRFEGFAIRQGISELYLMVEDKIPERNVLPKIYKGYGFEVITDAHCVQEDMIVMRKTLPNNRKTVRKTANKRRTTRRMK
jgi:hypothetical protein